MKRLKIFGISAALLLAGISLLSADETPVAPTRESIIQRMEEAEKNIQSVSFSFTQDIVYNLTNEKQTNRGEINFRKPRKLHVRQFNPIEQIIVSNGKKVWIYTPTYGQVVIDNWKKWIKNTMVPSSMFDFTGTNWAEMQKQYSFTYDGDEDGAYVMTLSPLAAGGWRMKFWIDTATLMPVKAVLYGDSITVTTRTANYTLNPDIDAKIFDFKTPEGVEVLTLP